MSNSKKPRVFWLPVVVTFVLAGAAVAIVAELVWPLRSQPPTRVTAARPPRDVARGLLLYDQQCAACHGVAGDGQGEAAYLLYPRPRNFTTGNFVLGSTQSGLPSDEDLLTVLLRGMPGSAMPSWERFTDRDRSDLVAAVRYLAIEGNTRLLVDQGGLPLAEAAELARENLRPGAPVEIPAQPQSVDMERGRWLYEQACASCHDLDGRGRTATHLTNSEGLPSLARDFTLGVFKGGTQAADLAIRIQRGMPGTAMPSFKGVFEPADLWNVARYVETFIQPGAQERVAQRLQVLQPVAVSDRLTTDPASPVWDEIPSTFLPLMPLWWRANRVDGVEVRVAMDSESLAFHLRWRDSSLDDQTIAQRSFGDAVAVQLSAAGNPPLFAMGSTGQPVNIWYWRAPWEATPGEVPDVSRQFPNTQRLPSYPQGTIDYAAGREAGNPLSQPADGTAVGDLNASGFGTLEYQIPGAQNVTGSGAWISGGWRVTLLRPLQSEDAGDVNLSSASRLSVAFAVWDGSEGDRNGQKLVTIWHTIEIAR